MKKTTKKVSKKKVSKKTNGKAKSAKPEMNEESCSSGECDKDAIKKKLTDFVNSDKFDKALDILEIITGKRDEEIAAKVKAKVDEMKVGEFVENLESTMQDLEAKGKKLMTEINKIFKK